MYLFHTDKGFSLVGTTSKNSLFCQRFLSSILPKTLTVYSGHLLDYSATMDQNGTIYIATLPDSMHLHYYNFEGNRFVHHTLISNEQSNFELSSPKLYTLNNVPYLIYVSHQIMSSNYDFVCENLNSSHLNSLLTLTTPPKHIKSYVTPHEVFIFFVMHDTQYHLNALVITNEGIRHVAYLTCNDPIIDYNICIDENKIHIVFETELHGKYQLAYFNTRCQKISTLITTQHPSEPIVFSYYNLIWINALVNRKLQIFLSINDGESFSIPTPCTLQTNLKRCRFMTHTTSPFVGQELYVSMTPRPKICTLAMIDIPHFHPDSKVPTELELLLEALSFKLEQLEEAMHTRSASQPEVNQTSSNTPPNAQPPRTASLAMPTRPYTSTSQSPSTMTQPTYNPQFTQPMTSNAPSTPMPQQQQPISSPMPQQQQSISSPMSQQQQPTSSPMSQQQQPISTPHTQPFTSEQQQIQPFITSPERPYTTSPMEEEENAIESAAEAFMDEFNGWDLPPRV